MRHSGRERNRRLGIRDRLCHRLPFYAGASVGDSDAHAASSAADEGSILLSGRLPSSSRIRSKSVS
jgi:hypothetical protein